MKYENEKMGCSFELPDRVTVRQQLAFWSAVNDATDASMARYWEAGKGFITNWKCDALPDPATSLDDLYSTQQAQIINWAASTIVTHIARLDEMPKNS